MSGSSDHPIGQRFSHAYLSRGEPSSDSARMRRRIASLIGAYRDLDDSANPFPKVAEEKLGIASPWTSTKPWRHFLEQWELRDVLDLITVAWQFLDKKGRYYEPSSKEKWIVAINEIFAEENVHYRVDARGGVHFAFDQEFEQNSTSTIKALGTPRYENARRHFENALRCLSEGPPNTLGAIRSTFFATEGLFKQIFPNEPRLTAKPANSLLPLIQKDLGDDTVAKNAAAKMLNSAKEWIEAAHFYRHEQGLETPSPPPLSLSIHIISTGAALLRWLAELDAKNPSP